MRNKKRTVYDSKDYDFIEIPFETIVDDIVQDRKCVMKASFSLIRENDMTPLFISKTEGAYYFKGQNEIIFLESEEPLYFPTDDIDGCDIELYSVFNTRNIEFNTDRHFYPYIQSIDYIDFGSTKSLNSFFGYDSLWNSSGTVPYIVYVKNMIANNVITAESAFETCKNLTLAENIDISNSDNNVQFFYKCESLKQVSNIKIKEGCDCSQMFSYCPLNPIPDLEYDKIGDVSSMFSYNTSLTSVDYINLSNATSAYRMFSDCTNLQTVGIINMPNAGHIGSLFSFCSSLRSIGELKCPNATNITSLFYSCHNLKTIGCIDVSSYETLTSSGIFDNCGSITYVGLISATDPEKIRLAAQSLTKHPGATENQYVIDISKNSQEVIDALADFTHEGWTIKTTPDA